MLKGDNITDAVVTNPSGLLTNTSPYLLFLWSFSGLLFLQLEKWMKPCGRKQLLKSNTDTHHPTAWKKHINNNSSKTQQKMLALLACSTANTRFSAHYIAADTSCLTKSEISYSPNIVIHVISSLYAVNSLKTKNTDCAVKTSSHDGPASKNNV